MVTQLPENDPVSSPGAIVGKVSDLANALTAFVADGCATVDADEYRLRLSICDNNPYHCRRGALCTVCGCLVVLKAKGRAWHCPIGLW